MELVYTLADIRLGPLQDYGRPCHSESLLRQALSWRPIFGPTESSHPKVYGCCRPLNDLKFHVLHGRTVEEHLEKFVSLRGTLPA